MRRSSLPHWKCTIASSVGKPACCAANTFETCLPRADRALSALLRRQDEHLVGEDRLAVADDGAVEGQDLGPAACTCWSPPSAPGPRPYLADAIAAARAD